MASTQRVKVRDNGANKLLEKLSKRIGVRIGIFGGENSEIAYIAAIHEFGTENAGSNNSVKIPRRSWLRDYVDGNNALIRRRIKQTAVQGCEQQGSLKAAFDVLGSVTSSEIQERISDGISPPNAASTIEKKGSSKPLIDRGIMRSAITWAVEIEND